MIRKNCTTNPLGQIKIRLESWVQMDFNYNPLESHEIAYDSENPLGFYTFTS